MGRCYWCINKNKSVMGYVISAIIVFALYTMLYIITQKQVPSSLSASVFALNENNRWVWTAMIFYVCFMCVPTYIEKTGENTQFLAFIAIAALAFVGAAPLVKSHKELAYKVHCVAAVVCAVCSQLVIMFNQPWLLFCWFPFVVAFAYMWAAHFAWRTKTFWAEMVCFGSTFIFCLI